MMQVFASKLISQISNFASAGYRMSVSLSAGYDSREVFAAASVAAKNDPSINLNVYTETNSTECEIARKVASSLGFNVNSRVEMFNHKFSRLKFNNSESLNNWLMALGGIYMPFILPVSLIPDRKDTIDLWGYVSYEWDFYLRDGTVVNGTPSVLTYDEVSSRIINSDISEFAKSQVLNEFKSLFSDVGVDSSVDNALDLYYMATRARHHYGLRWYKGLQNKGIPVGPLASSEQILLNWFCSINNFDKRQFHKDLLNILSPELMKIPFDSDWKDLNGISSLTEGCNLLEHENSLFYGESLDEDIFKSSSFAYARELASNFGLPLSSTLNESLRNVVNNALSDSIFIEFLNPFIVNEARNFANAPFVELPPEINNSFTLVCNLYLTYSAIVFDMDVETQMNNWLTCSIKRNPDSLDVIVSTPDSNASYEYAFYLMSGADRINAVEYSSNNFCDFPLSSIYENSKLCVVVFVKLGGSQPYVKKYFIN